MTISKETRTLDVSWGCVFGSAQAVKVGDTIYLAGQVSRTDPEDNFERVGEMESQMRQVYAHIAKLLEEYGAGLKNLVDEVLFVKDIEAACAARAKCLDDIFGEFPVLASNIVQIERLVFPQLLIEIKCVAKV